MKRMIYVIAAVFAAFFCGCTEEELPPVIELSSSQSQTIVLNPEGDTENVSFKADHDWYVEITGGEDWLTATPMQGTADKTRVTVTAAANTVGKRTGELKIACSDDVYVTVTLEQDGYVPTFELKETSSVISASAKSFEVEVFTDVQYSYEIGADWISDVAPKAAYGHKHTFYAEQNTLEEERSAQIVFTSDYGTLTYTVTQRPAGTEQDDWQYDEFEHHSLAMRFTADWCGYCPKMAEAFEMAQSRMSGSLEIVSMHGSGGLVFNDAAVLQRLFDVQGYPTGLVDGRAIIHNFSNPSTTAQAVYDVATETLGSRPAMVGIAAKSSNVLRNMTVDLTLYIRKAGDYKVTILLLEDNIIGYQNGVSDSDSYRHNSVARAAITSIRGETVKIAEDNTVWNKTYSGTIPGKCNLDNLRVLVYVEMPYNEDDFKSEVENAEYIYNIDTYVENCVSFELGSSVDL